MVLQAIQYEAASGQNPPSLRILDQLALPHKSVYNPIFNCEQAHAAIKQMNVRGAPAIAIVAALALAVQLGTEKLNDTLPDSVEATREYIGKQLEYLKTSRPTAVNLGDAVGKLKTLALKASSQPDASPQAVVQSYISAAERMLIDDVSDNKAIGEHGARWIEQNTTAGRERKQGKEHDLKVLTHCNTG